MKKYTSAPLPFQGQKRRFVHQLEELAVRLGGGGGGGGGGGLHLWTSSAAVAW